MIRDTGWLLFVLTLVSLFAAQGRAEPVPLFDHCTSAEHRAALAREMAVVGMQLSAREEAAPEPAAVQHLLRQLGAPVLVILDVDCTARVYGLHAQAFVLTPQRDVAAWAVRVAETVYALAPDSPAAVAPRREEQSPSPAPNPAPAERARTELGVLTGPTFVSGAEGVRARVALQLGHALLPWLSLALRGGVMLPAVRVGEGALTAQAQLVHGIVAARMRLLAGDRIALHGVIGAGPAWTRARGQADPPRQNREQATWTLAASAGLDFAFYATENFGLICASTVTTYLPGIDVKLATHTQALSRMQASLLVGPMLHF